jgi:hypothetical protein
MGRPRAYTVESIERAFEIHCPGRWERQAAGWVIHGTGVGDVHLRTNKEGYAYNVGAADVSRRMRETVG